MKIRKRLFTRPSDYLRLRYWWLHELRQYRAKIKYGAGSKRDIKVVQRELARLRKDYPSD